MQKNLNPNVLHAFKICHDVSVEELDREFDPDRTEPLETHALRFRAPKMDFKNKVIPNASINIEVKCDDENKISVIATKRIKPGNLTILFCSFC